MPLIPPKRVAEIRGVHVDTVARWVREGRLTPALLTAGGHARFDEAEIIAWTPPRRGRKPIPPAPTRQTPWRPRRRWPTNAKGQKHVGYIPQATPQITKALLEKRFEEHRGNPPPYLDLLPGEAAWRAKRRSQEYAARRLAQWTENAIIFGGMTRRELYDAIWKDPARTVARRSGMSDNGLRKVCKNYKIPMPPRGYWASKRGQRRSKSFRRKPLRSLTSHARKLQTRAFRSDQTLP